VVGLRWRWDPARRRPLLVAAAFLLVVSGVLAGALLALVPVAAPALTDPARAAAGGRDRVEATLAGLAIGLVTVLVLLVAGRIAVLVQGSADPATRWARARGLSAWQGLAAAALEIVVVVLPAWLLPGLVLLVLSEGPGTPADEVLPLWGVMLALVVVVLLGRALAAAATPVQHLAHVGRRDSGVGRDVRDVLVVAFAVVAVAQLLVLATDQWSVGLVVAAGVLVVLCAGVLLARALGGTTVVLVVAAATAVVILSAPASLTAAVGDARRLDVGAPATVTTERPPGAGVVARGTAALDAADLAATPALDSDAGVGGAPAGLLALDAAAAAEVLTWRADLAPPGGADAALATLVGSRPDVPLLPVPDGARGFALEVTPAATGQRVADALESVAVQVMVVHADGTGQLVDAGRVGPEGGTTAGGRGGASAPTEPLADGAAVVGVDVTTRFVPGASGELELALGDLVAVTGDGSVALERPSEPWQSWVSRSTGSQRAGGSPLEPVRVTSGDRGPVLRLAVATDPRTDRVGVGDPPTEPVAALVAGLSGQDVVELQGAGPLTRVQPVAVAGWLPRIGGRGAVVDLQSLTLARFGAGSAAPSARLWLVAEGPDPGDPAGRSHADRPVEDRAVAALTSAGLVVADELSSTSAPPAGADAADRPSVATWMLVAGVGLLALVGAGVAGAGQPSTPRAQDTRVLGAAIAAVATQPVVKAAVAIVVGIVVGAAVSVLLLPGLLGAVLHGAPARVVLQLLPLLPTLSIVPPGTVG
jgi:hypothetical protein